MKPSEDAIGLRALPDLKDQKIILTIGFGEVVVRDQPISGLAHLLHHNRLLHPMIRPTPVAVDV